MYANVVPSDDNFTVQSYIVIFKVCRLKYISNKPVSIQLFVLDFNLRKLSAGSAPFFLFVS